MQARRGGWRKFVAVWQTAKHVGILPIFDCFLEAQLLFAATYLIITFLDQRFFYFHCSLTNAVARNPLFKRSPARLIKYLLPDQRNHGTVLDVRNEIQRTIVVIDSVPPE